MTTCVVEFTILIPEFPGGCGGKGWKVRKGEKGERRRERGGFMGWLYGEKKGKRKEKEKRRDTHKH